MANEHDDPGALYDDPERLKPAGSVARRRPGQQRLSKHVPIRMPPEMAARIKAEALSDGLSLGGWVRQVVEAELDRRSEPKTVAVIDSITFTASDGEEYVNPRTSTYSELPESVAV